MFRRQSTAEAATRSDARHEAEVMAWWRDWHHYLEAHLQLLRTRHAEAATPASFERADDAWEQQRAEAEQALRRIPHDRRVVFDRARDERRRKLEAEQDGRGARAGDGALLDPDALERDALEQLLAEAKGTGADGEQWGAVPLPHRWYELDVTSLQRAPSSADYLAAAPDQTDPRSRLLMIAAVLALGVVSVWWTWPRGAAVAAQSADIVPSVDGKLTPPWSVRTVVVNDDAQYAITATQSLLWPTLGNDERGGWWRSQSTYPLRLCLPASALADASSLDVRGEDVPIRRYALAPTDGEDVALIVDGCGAAPTSLRRYGRLQAAAMPPDQSLEQTVTIGGDGASLRVIAIEVVGPAEDTQLPPDTYRVVVRVQASSAIDWVVVAPRLVFASGLSLLPSAPVASGTDGEPLDIEYLAPAWQGATNVALIVADPAGADNLRWRAELASPPDRPTLLARTLDVTVAGRAVAETDRATIRITVRNGGAQEVELRSDDIVVTQQEQPLSIIDAYAFDEPIASHSTGTFDVGVAPVASHGDINVAIAGMRFRLPLFAEGGDADP